MDKQPDSNLPKPKTNNPTINPPNTVKDQNHSNAFAAASAHFEEKINDLCPTPEFVEKLIEKGYFARTDLARIFTQLGYYVFRDTSNVERSTEALGTLIGFARCVDGVVKDGIAAMNIVERLAENLVVADAMREVSSRN